MKTLLNLVCTNNWPKVQSVLTKTLSKLFTSPQHYKDSKVQTAPSTAPSPVVTGHEGAPNHALLATVRGGLSGLVGNIISCLVLVTVSPLHILGLVFLAQPYNRQTKYQPAHVLSLKLF